MQRIFNAVPLAHFNLKCDITRLLNKEWENENYSAQVKSVFETAYSEVFRGDTEENIKKIVIGCLTLAFITNDRLHGTSLSKYSWDEIIAVTHSEKISDQSFYQVADYVLKDPRGCDSFDKTYHLKNHALFSSIESKMDTTTGLKR